MDFVLTRLSHKSSAFVPVSMSDFADIGAAKSGLIEALFLEEKFDVVVDNYLEFETCLLEATARHMLLHNKDYSFFQFERNLFNRRLLNLLSACRSYIDRSKHHVQAIVPEDGSAFDQLNARLSYHYDNCLGYRVMEALRNFVQHRGFPIHAVNYHSRRVGEESSAEVEFGLSVYTKSKYLREDSKFKKSVLREIDELGGRVNLKPLVGDFMSALGDVHELVRNLLRPKLESWDKIIVEAVERFKRAYPNESSYVGLVAVAKENNTTTERLEVNSDLIKHRKIMERKNRYVRKLGASYVTGKVSQKDA